MKPGITPNTPNGPTHVGDTAMASPTGETRPGVGMDPRDKKKNEDFKPRANQSAAEIREQKEQEKEREKEKTALKKIYSRRAVRPRADSRKNRRTPGTAKGD